jgi:hypothetical protein
MLRMARPAMALFWLLLLAAGIDLGRRESVLVGPLAAQEFSMPDRPVDKLSLGHPFWRRGGGLVYGSMALNNQNSYAVKDVIISCDFFDEWGNLAGRRATGIRRIFSSGRTWVSGIYLTLPCRNAQAGACRIISAKRVPDALVS